ncbi:hypothetical protein GCM10009626_18850 [Brachybacterium sacelli]
MDNSYSALSTAPAAQRPHVTTLFALDLHTVYRIISPPQSAPKNIGEGRRLGRILVENRCGVVPVLRGGMATPDTRTRPTAPDSRARLPGQTRGADRRVRLPGRTRGPDAESGSLAGPAGQSAGPDT